jgi:tRNA (cmo5U34)-methyltransferase
MSLQDAFDRAAPSYDALRRTLIPCFEPFYATALDLLEDAAGRAPAVLELGAGTGLLAAMVLRRCPEARLTLVDLAPAMLALAQRRFAHLPEGQVSILAADYAQSVPEMPGGYDAVISALSIHHLEDAAKQALFARIVRRLRPGGIFINADQVAGPTLARDALYRALWHQQVRAAGIGDDDLAAARERMTHDRMAPLESQLRWMAEAGFGEIDCAFKSWSFAVWSGCRPAAG